MKNRRGDAGSFVAGEAVPDQASILQCTQASPGERAVTAPPDNALDGSKAGQLVRALGSRCLLSAPAAEPACSRVRGSLIQPVWRWR